MRLRTIFSLLLLSLLVTGCSDVSHWAYQKGVEFEQRRAGLDEVRLTAGDINWHVLDSGVQDNQPTVLLIHGFGADSSNWVRFVQQLKGDYRFIVPDLPGHGQSTRTPDLNYQMALQAERLLALMDTLEIEQFHAVGSSMGGAITLALADRAPERVLSMGLMNAAGLDRRTEEFDAVLDAAAGDNPLIPQTADDFADTLAWAMHKPPYLPGFFIRVMGEAKAANAPTAYKIWADMQNDPYMHLDGSERLANLNQPTLIMWGEHDRLLGVDNVAPFQQQLSNSTSVVFDDLGHLPMAEDPKRSAAAFAYFWSDMVNNRQ